MFTRKRTSFTKFAFTFIGGAVVGIALGLLYAPKKGIKLQKELKEGIDDFSDRLKDVSGTVAGAIRKVANA